MCKHNYADLDEAIEVLKIDLTCFTSRNTQRLRGVDITQEMVDIIKALTMYGCKQIDIAKHLNLQQSMISKMNSGHFPLKDKTSVVPTITIDTGKIKALYRAKWPLSEIAADCGVNVEKVKDVLNIS